MPTYASEDVAWTAMYLSIFTFLVVVFFVAYSSCAFTPAAPHRSRVIKHIILTPGAEQA